MDAYALVQAERELSADGRTVPELRRAPARLQDVRRRQMGERRRLMTELGGLLQGTRGRPRRGHRGAREGAGRARAADRDDLRKAYQDLDAVLTPWQRGRFRQFEEQLERRKIELLAKIGGGKTGG